MYLHLITIFKQYEIKLRCVLDFYILNIFFVFRTKLHEKERFRRGSNSRPSACEADVITTTPRNRCSYCIH